MQQRLRTLYNTSVPTPFEVYATYEVPATGMADKSFHALIQKLNPELRLTANREFFEIEPWDAYDILEAMAKIHGRLDKLVQNKKNVFFKDPEKNNRTYAHSKDELFAELFEKIKNITLSIDPNLRIVQTKNYIVFKKSKNHNVISVWPKSNSLEVVLNAKRQTISDPQDLTYDISNRQWTAAQYAFRFNKQTDEQYAKYLIKQTYNLIK